MQLSVILILATALQVSAATATSAQGMVSFTGKDVPLEQVFASVKKQTGYTFVYYTEVLKEAHKVTIDVKDLPVEQFLDACLKDEPLTYKVVGQTVMITRKEVKSITGSGEGEPGAQVIRGRVTNEKGEPLSGASVMVKGSRKGTMTAADGTFILKGASPGIVLILSYAGFTQKEVRVDKTTDLSFILTPSTSPLDEAKVIAYGTTTDRFNTGNVTTVRASDIEKQPVSNPLLALEGRAPGLFITQSTGLAGSGVTVQIRGQNSIANGNDPFYVVDGVPYVSQLLPNLGAGLLGNSGVNNANSGNPMSFINPSDIESISVLKDAVATAIYGSRAANGAILITTKKGKAGQTKVDINVQNGWGQVTRKLDLMNTQQYLQMRHEAINNDGSTIGAGDYDLNGTWDTTRNTDWQKKLIGGTAKYTNANVSFSGGSPNTQYLIGGTYHRETTVFPGSFADDKGAIHVSINSTSSDQKFHIQLSGNYVADNNELPNNDLTGAAVTLAPVAPSLYNPDGSLNWAPTSSGTSTWTNPLSYLYNHYYNKTKNLIANTTLRYQILPGLDIQSSFGYSDLQSNEIVTVPLLSHAPETRATTPRAAEYGNNDITSWIIEPQIHYKQAISKGKLEALVGTTIEQNNSDGQQLYGYGYNSDQVMNDIASAPFIGVISTVQSVYKYNAAFGRLDYNWDDKYLIDLTARRDGSSRFGSANQFHDFSAAGIGWIFSQENFVKNELPLISFGKIRASYGTTGNDQIGDYKFLNLYTSTLGGVAYQQTTGLQPTGLANPYLEWEETKKLEVGADLGFLKDRVLLNASYYHNRSGNQLLSYPLPIITGYLSIAANLPATVQNSGWELTLNTVNVKSKNFGWSSHINLTIPQNKLVAFPNLASSSFAGAYVIGKPITIVSVFHSLGVNDSSGTYQFATSKGAPTYNPVIGTDNTTIISTAPKLFGGFQNDINYKGFELDFLFQFVQQKGMNNYFGNNLPGAFEGGLGNQPLSVINRWQNPGDKSSIQRYNADLSLLQQYDDASGSSDAAWSSASYIRLKNISLSWQLPAGWRNKAHMSIARVYVQAQNLLTITHYIGMDPETKSFSSLPPLRVLTGGFQFDF